MPDAIRILIVDDHPVVRDGLRGVFAHDPDFEVVGEASHGVEAVARSRVSHPDVVLMDLRMPGGDGITATAALRDLENAPQVLVLTTFDSDRDVRAAIEAGAVGYLLKDAPREDLCRAVRQAAEGQSVLAPSVAGRLIEHLRNPVADLLSEREVEVLQLVSQGRNNREIAEELFVSEATVKTHLLHTYAKLGVSDRAAAVAVAYERGILGRR